MGLTATWNSQGSLLSADYTRLERSGTEGMFPSSLENLDHFLGPIQGDDAFDDLLCIGDIADGFRNLKASQELILAADRVFHTPPPRDSSFPFDRLRSLTLTLLESDFSVLIKHLPNLSRPLDHVAFCSNPFADLIGRATAKTTKSAISYGRTRRGSFRRALLDTTANDMFLTLFDDEHRSFTAQVDDQHGIQYRRLTEAVDASIVHAVEVKEYSLGGAYTELETRLTLRLIEPLLVLNDSRALYINGHIGHVSRNLLLGLAWTSGSAMFEVDDFAEVSWPSLSSISFSGGWGEKVPGLRVSRETFFGMTPCTSHQEQEAAIKPVRIQHRSHVAGVRGRARQSLPRCSRRRCAISTIHSGVPVPTIAVHGRFSRTRVRETADDTRERVRDGGSSVKRYFAISQRPVTARSDSGRAERDVSGGVGFARQRTNKRFNQSGIASRPRGSTATSNKNGESSQRSKSIKPAGIVLPVNGLPSGTVAVNAPNANTQKRSSTGKRECQTRLYRKIATSIDRLAGKTGNARYTPVYRGSTAELRVNPGRTHERAGLPGFPRVYRTIPRHTGSDTPRYSAV